MVRLHCACRLFAVLTSLSVGRSLDSINLDLEVLEQIDLSGLGTPNLDRFGGTYEVTVDDDCNYILRVNFKKNSAEQPGGASPNFEGVCAPNNGAGNAPDGQLWHTHRRHWMQFPQYVYDTTGFDHVSLYWRPCGLPPKGLRQPRYDMNFYTVIPQYRAFWVCQEFKVPRVCRYNQTSFLGRGHFSLPRLERDPDFLANMPTSFQPDANEPEAYQYEGLISYAESQTPETVDDWILPTYQMSTYDGDVTSFRALLPQSFVSGSLSSVFFQTQFYVFQSMPRLPQGYNMTYDTESGVISVMLQGSAGMCGAGFDEAKAEQEGPARLRRGF
jgi:hypothetical protein